MGYIKINQYGDIVEIYEYEKNIRPYKERFVSAITKKRAKKAREHAKATGTYKRKNRNILRTTQRFFRLCHHNNVCATTIHFVTLTFAYDLTYKTATRHLARFMERVTKNFKEMSISYISVPELTAKGRYHFHLLVYGLPPETAKRERETRNFQRQFQRGYIDIRFAPYTSHGIAGYMAKYMAKALGDSKNETTRGYNCSRNIKQPFSAGSNSLDQYTNMIIPTEGIVDTKKREYDVPYLGKCLYTKITKI